MAYYICKWLDGDQYIHKKDYETNLKNLLELYTHKYYTYKYNTCEYNMRRLFIMFIGREKELNFLTKRYQTIGFDFIPIYGRRRVGKTELIQEFIKDKPAIIYSATEQNDKISLSDISEQVSQFFLGTTGIQFESWDKLFVFMGEHLTTEKLIFVIDEYPYLCKNNPSLSSILQKHMDHTFQEKNIMIILCGSSMSFMEHQVLGYNSPLYGRRTGQIKLLPFDYQSAGEFIQEEDPVQKMLLFAVADGIPQYLKYLGKSSSLEEGIVDNFFEITGHLFEEPSSLLKQELREPANYFSILLAISLGKSKLNEIAAYSDLENTTCSKYLKSLMDLRIIEREVPVGNTQKKNGIYKIADNCFCFWFRFVKKYMTNIEFGNGSNVWNMIKEKYLTTYMGMVFEKASQQYLLNHIEQLPIMPIEIGRWWGNNPIKKCQEEIDILAISSEKEAIFGECKWKNEKLDMSVLENLLRKSELFPQYEMKYYYFFSKSGFTNEVKEYANTHKNIYLISLEEMYSI